MRPVVLVVILFVITGETCARRNEREAGVDVEEYAGYVTASSPTLITAEPHHHCHYYHRHHRHYHHHPLNASGELSGAQRKECPAGGGLRGITGH